MQSIYSLPKLYKAKILARPSKICKSPYLADVQVFDEFDNIIEENVMAHSPALGCCGMIIPDVYVLCTKSESTTNKSKYIIHNIIQETIGLNFILQEIIGVNPMLANPITKSLLLNNKIEDFQDIKELKSEVVVHDGDHNSRFDFSFLTNKNQKVYLEVKNVPLADLRSYDPYSKIAIFPDGYRKNKSEPVSERALKHVNHLAKIHKEDPSTLCVLLFLIQRNDVDSFKPSSLDPIYQKAVYDAIDIGVQVIPVCVSWKDNSCYYLKKVKVVK
jgi:DNA-binding sugar fermentation-stimulating protein